MPPASGRIVVKTRLTLRRSLVCSFTLAVFRLAIKIY